jgi:hypothetical protein
MYRRMTEQLRTEFFDRLERKTGWGKEEIRKEFDAAITMVLADMLDGSHMKVNLVEETNE